MSLNPTRVPQRRGERGSVFVETVFVLPVLLLIVFAIADFGIAFGRYQLVINSAQLGARIASLNRASCNPATVAGLAEAGARNAFQGLGVQPGDPSVSVVGACAPGNTEVTVEYTHDFPIIAALSGLPATLQLHYTAVRATEVPAP